MHVHQISTLRYDLLLLVSPLTNMTVSFSSGLATPPSGQLFLAAQEAAGPLYHLFRETDGDTRNDELIISSQTRTGFFLLAW